MAPNNKINKLINIKTDITTTTPPPTPTSTTTNTTIAATTVPTIKKKVFVLDFNGGVTALQVNNLREEITAILLAIKNDSSASTNCNTNEKNEYSVLLKLKSGGGTVTGYGLASGNITIIIIIIIIITIIISTISSIEEEGIPLTILIDEVAASGGYMMAVTGDKIVAAPFAMIGSIGVVATIPNISRLLKKWGIDVHDYTAGRFKRTVTPYKRDIQRSC